MTYPNEREHCEHQDFEAVVDVNRLSADEGGPIIGYSADVRIVCAVCGEPFVFMGLPIGSMANEPASNVDGTEARVPIRPQSAPEDFGLGLLGFHIDGMRSG